MVEEQATVVELEGEFAWLRTHRQSSCGQCSVKGGCGTQVLSRVVGNKVTYVRCYNSKQVKVGDTVVVGIRESALLSGSFLLYFLPLITMLLMAALWLSIAQTWWSQWTDLFAITGAVIGLYAGLLISNKITRKKKATDIYQPVILKVLNTDVFPVHSLGSGK